MNKEVQDAPTSTHRIAVVGIPWHIIQRGNKERFMSIDQIANEALRLSPHDRATLAEAIWESLEDPYILFPDISDDEAISLAKPQ